MGDNYVLFADFCYYMLCYLCTSDPFIQAKQPALVRRFMPCHVICLMLDINSTFILWFNFQEEVISQINTQSHLPQ